MADEEMSYQSATRDVLLSAAKIIGAEGSMLGGAAVSINTDDVLDVAYTWMSAVHVEKRLMLCVNLHPLYLLISCFLLFSGWGQTMLPTHACLW